MSPIFITGIGTDIGKTLVSAIVTEALHADYWKPVQAGFAEGTDAERVQQLLSNNYSVVHSELYRLHSPVSPHIAARQDGITIEADIIQQSAQSLMRLAEPRKLVIEGAGGLLVPLNDTLLVADLILLLKAKVILVSRNYLGSINHSLLSAAYCRDKGIDVAGWIFNDDYLSYEEEIVQWSGYPSLGSIPNIQVDKASVKERALQMQNRLLENLNRLP